MGTTMPITFRTELLPSDRAAIRAMVDRTGVFNAVGLDCAVELADGGLQRARQAATTSCCRARRPRGRLRLLPPHRLTVGSYDLYWIAVDKSVQGQGPGRKLMDKVAEIIRRGRRPECLHRDFHEAALSSHPSVLRALRLPFGGYARRFLRPR